MTKSYTPPSRFREWLSRVLSLRLIFFEPYSPAWDHYLRVAIELGMVRPRYYGGEEDPRWFSDYMVEVGDKMVWVGNYAYAYGVWDGKRPSYKTIKLLRKVQLRLMRENEEKK